MSHAYVCDSCGKQIDPKNKFCVSCGSTINIDLKFCEKCGNPIVDDAKFCVRCGHKSPIDKTEEEVVEDQEQEEENIARLENTISYLCNLSLPSKDEMERVVEEFDFVRKSKLLDKIDDDKLLTVFTNIPTAILQFYETRPFVIKALLGYNEAFTLSINLERKELTDQLRFILAHLNLYFGDLIFLPSKREKYYSESFKLIQKISRDIEAGKITGENSILTYMLKSELLQRRGNIKQSLITINLAIALANEYPHLINEAKLLKTWLLIDSARYEEANDLLAEIDENELTNPKSCLIIKSRISSLIGDTKETEELLNEIIAEPTLSAQNRISSRLRLVNLSLKINPDTSKNVFSAVFNEEIDEYQRIRLKELEIILDEAIQRQNVNYEIKKGKAEEDMRNRISSMQHAQGNENWDGVVFNSKRILEILEEYGHVIDEQNLTYADANFRQGDALYNRKEYDLAYAYYETALDVYETGVGDPVKYPTVLKHVVQTQVMLRQYESAYKSAVKGKSLAQEITHPGLISEFDEFSKKFHPTQLEKLRKYNELMNLSLPNILQINNLYKLFSLLGLDQSRIPKLDNVYLGITMDALRSDHALGSVIFEKNQQVNDRINQIMHTQPLIKMIQSPIGLIRNLPGYHTLITFAADYIKETQLPPRYAGPVITEAVLRFGLNSHVFRQNEEITPNIFVSLILDYLNKTPIEIMAIILLASILTFIEGSVYAYD